MKRTIAALLVAAPLSAHAALWIGTFDGQAWLDSDHTVVGTESVRFTWDADDMVVTPGIPRGFDLDGAMGPVTFSGLYDGALPAGPFAYHFGGAADNYVTVGAQTFFASNVITPQFWANPQPLTMQLSPDPIGGVQNTAGFWQWIPIGGVFPDSFQRAVTLTIAPVPEPGVLVLMAAGLVGMCVARGCRTQKATA